MSGFVSAAGSWGGSDRIVGGNLADLITRTRGKPQVPPLLIRLPLAYVQRVVPGLPNDGG